MNSVSNVPAQVLLAMSRISTCGRCARTSGTSKHHLGGSLLPDTVGRCFLSCLHFFCIQPFALCKFLLCVSSLSSLCFPSSPCCCPWCSRNKETEHKASLLLSPPPITRLHFLPSPLLPSLPLFLTSPPLFSSPGSFCHLSSSIYPRSLSIVPPVSVLLLQSVSDVSLSWFHSAGDLSPASL